MKELFNKIEKIEVYKMFFNNLLKQKSHAFLLTSTSEKTLKLFVQYFLLKENCAKSFPCLNCSNCLKILNNSSVDINYYPTKTAINVEDVLSMIDEINVKPLDLNKRFYVFNNIDNSSFQAQNKLLKTLEEPPANVVFILTTVQEENVLLTIKSRAIKMNIPSITENDLYLFKDCFKTENDLKLAFKLGNGNIGELIDDESFNKNKIIYESAKEILSKLKKSSDVNNLTQKIIKQKGESAIYLKCFEIIFRDAMIKLTENNVEIIDDMNLKACLNIINKIEKANEKLQANTIENGVIDDLLLGILEEKYLCRQK